MPLFAFPLYLFLGRNKFRGHKKSIRRKIDAHRRKLQENKNQATSNKIAAASEEEKVFETLAESQFFSGNQTRILKDGKAAFGALFDSIRGAQDYILLQFYIVRNDRIGKELKDLLLEKAKAGVRVYFMYDAWGCTFLSKSYISELNQKGCQMRPFEIKHKLRNFFQVNFRNHRKLVVVDGRIGLVGGLNIGDEYCVSQGKRYWRDTQLEVTGPVVHSLQASFLADWSWATDTTLKVNWTSNGEVGDKRILGLFTGPADSRENGSFLFLQAILSAKKRIWISSPYFVPDDAIMKALELASIRGVEVILLLPKIADHYLTWLASFAYMPEVVGYGVKIYRFFPGFLHQKAFLIDDEFAAIGSANLDIRSIRLNFEVTLLVSDRRFVSEVASILEADMKQSELFNPKDQSRFGTPLKIASKFARLFAPIL